MPAYCAARHREDRSFTWDEQVQRSRQGDFLADFASLPIVACQFAGQRQPNIVAVYVPMDLRFGLVFDAAGCFLQTRRLRLPGESFRLHAGVDSSILYFRLSHEPGRAVLDLPPIHEIVRPHFFARRQIVSGQPCAAEQEGIVWWDEFATARVDGRGEFERISDSRLGPKDLIPKPEPQQKGEQRCHRRADPPRLLADAGLDGGGLLLALASHDPTHHRRMA